MSWYHVPGNQQDVAVSTRVRLARNLAGYPFPARLDAAGAKSVTEAVGAVLEKNGFIRIDFADISRGAAGSLVEKCFITPRFVSRSLLILKALPSTLSQSTEAEQKVPSQLVTFQLHRPTLKPRLLR